MLYMVKYKVGETVFMPKVRSDGIDQQIVITKVGSKYAYGVPD